MKKRISILLCVILATTLLAACASSGGGSANSTMSRVDMAMPAPSAEAPMAVTDSVYSSGAGGSAGGYFETTDDWDEGGFYETERSLTGGEVLQVSATSAEAFVEKIIYSVYADIETIEFDETIDKVHALMQRYGAFIESSSISGVNYSSKMHGWMEFRYAHFSLRVPNENLDGITANLDNLGNVTHRNSHASNITSQFYDTQSRLNSLRVQEERLLDMLSKAVDVPELIMIEERLSDVRYQIESLTSTLKNWQNQVDFSTLTINIREVEEYTEPTLIHRTYWQQIGDGFMTSVRGVGRFFMDLFRWLIVSAPVLILLAIIGVVIFLITRRQIRKYAEKRKNAPVKQTVYPAYVYQQPGQYRPQENTTPQPQYNEIQPEQTESEPVQEETQTEETDDNTEESSTENE